MDIFVECKSGSNVDVPIIGCLVECKSDSNIDVFDELKSDSNIDFPLVGCLVEYKSGSNVDFSIIGCLYWIQRWQQCRLSCHWMSLLNAKVTAM